MDHAADTAPANVIAPAAHTPGPWCVVDQHFNRSAIHIRHAGPFGNEVATLYHAPDEDDSQDPEGVWRNDPVRMANARLIAAAPDLLEALVAAVAIADEALEEWDKAPSGMRTGKILIALSGGCPGYRADIDAIHAAIAKARGTPPDP